MFGNPRTLTGMLARRAARNPEGVPVIVPGRHGAPDAGITYTAIWERARAVAAWLEAPDETDNRARTDPHDRVLVAAPAGLDFLAAVYGAMLARCMPVPAPPPFGSDLTTRLATIAGDCGPRRILAGDGWHQLNGWHEMFGRPGVAAASVTGIASIPAAPDGWSPSRTPAPRDVAYIQYTSGTTGRPKGALIPHEKAIAGLQMTRSRMKAVLGGLSASPLPPWHDFANALLHLCVYAGHTVVATPVDHWVADPLEWLADLSRRQVTAVVLPSLAYRFIAGRLQGTPADELEAKLATLDLSSVQFAVTGADVTSPDEADTFLALFARYGLRADVIRDVYGSADAMLAVTCEQLTGGRGHQVIRADYGHLTLGRIVPSATGVRLSCSGKPLKRTRVKIRRLDGEEFCPAGEIGEIFLQGPQLCTRYWARSTPWTVVAGEKWFATGDLGAQLPDGTLVLLGRRHDMITLGMEGQERLYLPFLLERTAARAAGRAVRPHTVTVFQDGSRVIVAAESGSKADPDAVKDAITGAVEHEYGIILHDVVLAGQGSIPRTTSGKLCRGECRRRWRDGTLRNAARSQSPARAPVG